MDGWMTAGRTSKNFQGTSILLSSGLKHFHSVSSPRKSQQKYSFRFTALVLFIVFFFVFFFRWVVQSKRCASISNVMGKQKGFAFSRS